LKKPEQIVSDRVANYLKEKHPDVPFRFDLGADVPLPMVHAKRNKELHGIWSRGYPDVFIATCRGGYGGLYVELKATDEVANNEHTRRQAIYHAVLRKNGYYVKFVCGFEEAKSIIKKYLKNKLRKD
jgi:hypothetical protein